MGRGDGLKTYIFDIDGTIANTDHRVHHLEGDKKDWKSWYAKAQDDIPYWEIVDLMRLAHDAGIAIVICTGRDSGVRKETEEWLSSHNLPYHQLYMRKAGDRRDDTIVKFELLEQMQQEGYDPVLVFEDRDRVVKMWRDAGLKCLQVKPGEY